MSRLPSFPGRMLRLAAATGALVVISSSPAALMLTATTVLVAVSALSLVVLMAVLGRGPRHHEALKVLRVVLSDRRRTAAGQDTGHAPHPGSSRRAVHRSIAVVDVEGFGDDRRASWHQVGVRDGLYQAMESAFAQAGIPWARCDHEDRGDGIFILVPPEVPKELLAESLPPALAAELGRHNLTHDAPERIRLRMALHAGEVRYDRHGTTAAAVNLAFRLLEADALKAALAAAPGVLAVITSAWFFHEVIRHNPACDQAAYNRVQVTVKETTTTGWIHLPDHNHPSSRPTADARPVRKQLTEAGCPAVWDVAGQGLGVCTMLIYRSLLRVRARPQNSPRRESALDQGHLKLMLRAGASARSVQLHRIQWQASAPVPVPVSAEVPAVPRAARGGMAPDPGGIAAVAKIFKRCPCPEGQWGGLPAPVGGSLPHNRWPVQPPARAVFRHRPARG